MLKFFQQYKGHTGKVFSCSFDLKFFRMASCSSDNTVKIWKIITGQCINTLSFFSSHILEILWQNEKDYIIAGEQCGLITIVQGKKYQIIRLIHCNFSGFLILDKINYNLWSLNNNSIEIYNIASSKFIFCYEKNGKDIYSFDVNKINNNVVIGYDNGEIQIFESHLEMILLENLYFGNFVIQRLCYSSDGIYLGVCTSKQLILYNIDHKNINFRWSRQYFSIYEICYDPTNQFIAVCKQEDTRLCIYQIFNSKFLAQNDEPHIDYITGLKWHTKYLIASSADKTISIWEWIQPIKYTYQLQDCVQ